MATFPGMILLVKRAAGLGAWGLRMVLMVTCRCPFRHSLRRPGPTIATKGHFRREEQSMCTNFVLALRTAS